MIDYLLRANNLVWSSDWNADEVGYDHLGDAVIGLYIFTNQSDEKSWCMYINMDTMELLEIWSNNDDEDF